MNGTHSKQHREGKRRRASASLLAAPQTLAEPYGWRIQRGRETPAEQGDFQPQQRRSNVMKSDHIDQLQPRHRRPRFIYHTPFAYLALLLALMMVVPIPRVAPVPEARADGANGDQPVSIYRTVEDWQANR